MNIDLLRADTPACQHPVFFNNASASLTARPVAQAMINYQQCELDLGLNAAADHYAQAIAAASTKATAMLAAEGGIDFFDTVSGGHAQCLQMLQIKPGDRLLMAEDEWGGIIPHIERYAAQHQARVDRIHSRNGIVDIEHLKSLLDERVRLISLPSLPAVGGAPNPLAQIAALDRPEACLIFADAAQSWGHMPLDVSSSGCDVMLCTARKWIRGPRGISLAAYSAKARHCLEASNGSHHQCAAEKIGSDYTRLLRIGLGAAIDYAQTLGVDAIQQRILHLAAQVHAGLRSLPHLHLLYDQPPASGMLSFSAEGREAELAAYLAQRGIVIGVLKSAFHPGLFKRHARQQVLRISCQYYNLESEVAQLLQALQDWRPGI